MGFGVETDYMLRNVLDVVPSEHILLDGIFCVYFLTELLLRIFVNQKDFFAVEGWGWNVFDTVLVLDNLVETTLSLIGPGEYVVGLRYLRFVRSLPPLHFLHFGEEIRVLGACVVHSAKSFFWASLMLLLMVYLSALFFIQVVHGHRVESVGEPADKVFNQWTSLPFAVMSLFQGLTGGLDWHEVANPLVEQISPIVGVLFCGNMAFLVLGMMNIFTATIVEGVSRYEETAREMAKKRSAYRLFKGLGLEADGEVTLDNLLDHLDTPEVVDFFKSIDIDMSEARHLFELLDTDEDGELSFEDFINGCIRMQSPAKTLDLVLATKDIPRRRAKEGTETEEDYDGTETEEDDTRRWGEGDIE